MESICKNEELLKYIFVAVKYVLPALLIVIGFINLVTITNTKKAIKRFLTFGIIGLMICLLGFYGEKQINNKCETYNKVEEPITIEPQPEPQEPTQPSVINRIKYIYILRIQIIFLSRKLIQ